MDYIDSIINENGITQTAADKNACGCCFSFGKIRTADREA